MSKFKILDSSNLGSFFDTIISLVEKFTGKVSSEGTLQEQIDQVKEDLTTKVAPTNASLGQGYGTCSTAEATTAKVATLSNYTLVTGGIVAVKFTYAVPANATLNINDKGTKPIYYQGSTITANVIQAGTTAIFIYDGSRYHLLSVDKTYVDLEEIDTTFEEVF